ncbi:DUF7933 domain-containing protein [Microbacterium hydrocarbonoxydans]|uniref:DUF7933 domain-containing protein n=1 Tax=Microbacterium hydrocarbonoxydans TaxID=273678 RepID=UPI00203E2941|nr:hypothetical protein [Microbacterium hydrocarbonoxydans]MCM3778897.1 hypothetical protein [Microbacterium hydrocarbonoxydans]
MYRSTRAAAGRGSNGRRRRARRASAGCLAVVVLLTASGALGAAPVEAAAGQPGIPVDPVVVYSEDFENESADPQMITSYAHASVPGSYTADAFWRRASACNGIVLSGAQTATSYTDPSGSGTCGGSGFDALRYLPPAIGRQNGEGEGNHALSAFTAAAGPANLIELETPDIPVVTGRWYTASLRFAAGSCAVSSPVYSFFLVDPATGVQTSIGAPVTACTAPGSIVVDGVRHGTIQSPGALIWTGSDELRLRVRNGNGSSAGNDGAIDDIALVDATPQLDKEHIPATGLRPGDPFTTRFTITNTSELAEKTGIRLTDDMPTGLAVGPTGVTTNTCGGTVAAAAGSDRIEVSEGVLAQGQASCVIEVPTVATRTGVVVDGPDNIESPLLPPLAASGAFSDPRADDDEASSAQGVAVTVPVLDGDTAVDPAFPLDRTSVVFAAAGQPAGSATSDGGRTLSVPGQGVYTADPATGAVTFTPDPVFSGAATSVVYQVTDSNGVVAAAAVRVFVAQAPTVVADEVTAAADQPARVDVTDNDRAGFDRNGEPATIDPTTVLFPAASQPPGARISDDGRALTVPGQGAYAADRITGAVTFTPEAGFSAVRTAPVTYQVAQSDGATGTATIVVTVIRATGGGPGVPQSGSSPVPPASLLSETGGTPAWSAAVGGLVLLAIGGVLMQGGARRSAAAES